MQLSEWPLPFVRVKCAKCDREGRMKRINLLDRFGPGREMFVVREKLTAEGCQRPDKKQPCLSILQDALLVQAILSISNGEEAMKPELLPEAREWRKKLGLDE